MSVDWDKPIQCCGRPARLLGTLEKCGTPMVVAVMREDGSEECVYAKDDGASLYGCFEITNVPQRHVRWVNVYRDDENRIFLVESDTKEDADASASKGRIACVRVEFEEGEGL